MKQSWPSRDPRHSISRRRLLEVSALAGLSALSNACASQTGPEGANGPASTITPSLAATSNPQPSTTGGPAVPAPVSNALPSVMLCREAWGARPARPGGTPQTPSQITIHHSAVVLGDNRNAPERIRADQRYHQDSKKWIDIAYHIGVDRKGNIYQLRDPEIVGDTATSYMPDGHLLILCEGNFDEEDVTDELLAGVALASAWGLKRYSISPEMISGHRDFASTSCPGANLYASIQSGAITRRAEDLVGAGAGDLPLLCGPDAVARVAAIEAGD